MAREYYIIRSGRDGKTLFLVDRRRYKVHWWTAFISRAMRFPKKSVAEEQARKLRYGNPRVIDAETAKGISRRQEQVYGVVPEPEIADPLEDDVGVKGPRERRRF